MIGSGRSALVGCPPSPRNVSAGADSSCGAGGIGSGVREAGVSDGKLRGGGAVGGGDRLDGGAALGGGGTTENVVDSTCGQNRRACGAVSAVSKAEAIDAEIARRMRTVASSLLV